MHLAKTVAFIVIFMALPSCSTTGFVTQGSLILPRTVSVAPGVHPEVAPYVPQFVDALREHGFTVGETSDPDALVLQLEFNPNPFNLRVSASLLQRGIPVLTASATNSGWGTALARGVAVNGRAEAAASNFRAELTKLMLRVKFKQNAP
jgi:hypothetical protein